MGSAHQGTTRTKSSSVKRTHSTDKRMCIPGSPLVRVLEEGAKAVGAGEGGRHRYIANNTCARTHTRVRTCACACARARRMGNGLDSGHVMVRAWAGVGVGEGQRAMTAAGGGLLAAVQSFDPRPLAQCPAVTAFVVDRCVPADPTPFPSISSPWSQQNSCRNKVVGA